ncbi:MAG: dTDP-4-dehydrorhamnose 3,5-epimerase [Bacteroidales bacterium]
MNVISTEFKDLCIIEPSIHSDSRGYFMESFNSGVFSDKGINFIPVQDNESSSSRGVIRGLHYQLRPFDQAKLIRVITGKIFDVAVDLRKESRTFGKWFGTELDSSSKRMIFVPRGFAHGFSVLSETALILYKCDNLYNKIAERGIALDDPFLGIDWKIDPREAVISEKDRNNPVFNKAEFDF